MFPFPFPPPRLARGAPPPPTGTLIAVGDGGAVFRSTDEGQSWEARTAAEANDWSAVAYGNGVWVAVATTGTNRVMTSEDDGLTWVARSCPVSEWTDIDFVNGLFIATGAVWTGFGGDPARPTLMTSPDGLTWTTRITGDPRGGLRGVAFGAGRYVAAQLNGNAFNNYWHSTDAESWTNAGTPTTWEYGAVAFGAGIFVMLGTANGGQNATSATGTSWTQRAQPPFARDIVFASNLFVAGTGNEPRVYTSPDGLVWTQRNFPPGFTYASGRGLARAEQWIVPATTSGGGTVLSLLQSPDTVSWSVLPATLPLSIRAMAYRPA